jgi:thiol-disulfide isomerase/thioredoxin
MKFIFLSFFLISTSLFAQNKSFKLKTGDWTAHLSLNEDNKVPFKFSVEKKKNSYQFSIYNAEEKIVLKDVEFTNDSVSANFSEYNSKLIFKITPTELIGSWVNMSKKNARIPFNAKYGYTSRFEKKTTENPLKIDGKWKVFFNPNSKSEFIAMGFFHQKEEKVTGTFLTETGDFRFLEGNQYGKELMLSCFDGSHAYLFKATIENDSIFGRFLSGITYEGNWTGKKDEKFELSDPYSLTKVTNHLPIQFAAKQLDGTNFIFPNENYFNKVTIIQIMGTWCPNCLDETRFYKELYEKYHDKGLEIIAIGFEAGDNFDISAAKLEKFKAKNGADFTFLLGGTSTKKAASDLFPMVDGIKSFPTSFYIGKDGTIQKIYTGFNGPGTGIYYEKYVEETYKVIEGMLK